MPKALKDYDIPLSDTRLDRLAFRVEHWLLSAGSSDMAKLRGYLRVKVWRDCRSPRERLHAIKVLAKLPARALRDAWGAIRAHGDAARDAGISTGRQLLQLWWLRVRHGVGPAVYYTFELYRPDQLRRAPNFFQLHEDDYLYRLLNVRVAADEAELLLDKARFERWLVEHRFPTVRTLMEFADGEVVHSDGLHGGLPECDLFSKPNDALMGMGTARWVRNGDGWLGADGRRRGERELLAELAELSKPRGLLLQENLRNHPALAALAPATLSTVRVLTLRGLDDSIQVILAVCKIPVGEAPTDHMRLGGMAAPIDLATGRLGRAIRKDEQRIIAPCDRHPDTGVMIPGFQLPCWEDVKALAVSAHQALDRIVCVGWDVAILDRGPILIEGNDNPGQSSSQLPTGLALGETPIARTMLARLEASFANVPLNARRVRQHSRVDVRAAHQRRAVSAGAADIDESST